VNALRISWLYLKVGVMNELQYRVNFFVQILQSLIQVGTALVLLKLVYSHTTELNGWSQSELLSLIGVQVLLGGVIHAFIQPNMLRLMEDVQQGTLDFALTKPEDSQLLISVRMVRMWQVVEIVSGMILVGFGLGGVEESIGFLDAVAFGIAILIGGVLVYCFWLVMTTGAFWIVRMENVLELFEGIYQTGRWPVTVYPGRGADVKAALADAGARDRVRLRAVRLHALVLALRPAALLGRVGLRRPELQEISVGVVEVVRAGVHPVELHGAVNIDACVTDARDRRLQVVGRDVEREMDATEALAFREGRVLLEHQWAAVQCKPLFPAV
jgi:ABC-2 type transport system permease protein